MQLLFDNRSLSNGTASSSASLVPFREKMANGSSRFSTELKMCLYIGRFIKNKLSVTRLGTNDYQRSCLDSLPRKRKENFLLMHVWTKIQWQIWPPGGVGSPEGLQRILFGGIGMIEWIWWMSIIPWPSLLIRLLWPVNGSTEENLCPHIKYSSFHASHRLSHVQHVLPELRLHVLGKLSLIYLFLFILFHLLFFSAAWGVALSVFSKNVTRPNSVRWS